jgi:hypothetical protein
MPFGEPLPQLKDQEVVVAEATSCCSKAVVAADPGLSAVLFSMLIASQASAMARVIYYVLERPLEHEPFQRLG